MSTDAIVLPKEDHKQTRKLFCDFESAQMLELKKSAPRQPMQPGALKKAVDAVLG